MPELVSKMTGIRTLAESVLNFPFLEATQAGNYLSAGASATEQNSHCQSRIIGYGCGVMAIIVISLFFGP